MPIYHYFEVFQNHSLLCRFRAFFLRFIQQCRKKRGTDAAKLPPAERPGAEGIQMVEILILAPFRRRIISLCTPINILLTRWTEATYTFCVAVYRNRLRRLRRLTGGSSPVRRDQKPFPPLILTSTGGIGGSMFFIASFRLSVPPGGEVSPLPTQLLADQLDMPLSL